MTKDEQIASLAARLAHEQTTNANLLRALAEANDLNVVRRTAMVNLHEHIEKLDTRLAEAEETYRSEIRGLHETSNTLHKDRDRLQARLAEAEMQNKRMRYALQSIADDVYDPWTNGAQAQRIAISALAPSTPRFAKTFCSQCGGEFGPGDSGYSHCEDHRAAFSADDVINAQHDETGRTWRGPRSQLPSRYFEITSICCLDYPLCDCNSPPEPDDDWLCFQRPTQPKVTP